MPKIVLDASVVLAVILNEPGARTVTKALKSTDVIMSTVNVSEVAARLHLAAWTKTDIESVVSSLRIRQFPFDSKAAMVTGEFRLKTQPFSLGLGDRACLATGYLEGCPVLTCDREWKSLKIAGLQVQCIR